MSATLRRVSTATGKIERRLSSQNQKVAFAGLIAGRHFDQERHGLLRVFDNGIIHSPEGLPYHPHRSFDIVTVCLPRSYNPITQRLEGGGTVKHADVDGNEGFIGPGSTQVMSVGSNGTEHTEKLVPGPHSANAFQIWIQPTVMKKESVYGTLTPTAEQLDGKWVTLANGVDKSTEEAVSLNSPSRVLTSVLQPGKTIGYSFGANRLGYLVPTGGKVEVNGVEINPHDGAQISEADSIEVKATGSEPAHLVLVDTVEFPGFS